MPPAAGDSGIDSGAPAGRSRHPARVGNAPRIHHATHVALGILATAACIWAATQLNGYYVFVLANVALLAIVGIGLNVLIGFTGQVSFGHVGFYAIGAYAVAILTTKAGLSFWIAWPLATLLSGVVGYLVAQPALRVRGPYLAMVTIAFGFIVEHGVIEMRGLTGGQNGLMGLPRPGLVGFEGSERTVTIIAIIAVAIALAGFRWLSHGAWGAAMRAVRDSDVAAESVGIDPVVVKTVAFAGSAALAGLAGGLFALLSGFVTPSSFSFLQSILFVLVVLLGGAGSFAGPLVGAVIVGALPEVLASLEEYRLLLFGALLLVVLWVAPDGVVGVVRRVRQVLLRRHRASGGGNAGADPQHHSPLADPQQHAPLGDPATDEGVAGNANDARPLPLSMGARHSHALETTGLSMQFGGVRAVGDLSLRVAPASITGLIGPNGAGKTTAINMLSGFYRPTAGTIRLGDEMLAGRRAMHIARSGIARTYQTSQLFGSLSVADNVALAMTRGRLGPLFGSRSLRAPEVRTRILAMLHFCGYAGDPDAFASDLPHVDRRLVEIARALATGPAILLLDEPAAGLSLEDKGMLGDLLRRIAGAGIGVVLVEHDMELVMRVCDRIVVLDAGQHLAEGTAAEIRADRKVRDAYLGAATVRDSSVDTGRGGASEGVADAAQRNVGTAARSAPERGPECLGIGHLSAGYGAGAVLHDLDLQIRRGETVALLGANGAGKSTLMRAIAGLHRPVSGGIHFEGRDLVPLSAERIAGAGVILVPEGRQVFPELSVSDNLRLGAFLHADGADARMAAVLARFPRLGERLEQRAGLLSGGEQQMLALGRALMGKPRILLLDEPSLGLAPKMIAELFDALDALRAESMTILLVDQMATLALELCDSAYVIESGRIVARGDASAIAADPALAKAYLGG